MQIAPLVVTFKCGYCPKGVSGALIKYLLTNEMKSEIDWKLKTDEIFRDQVSLLVGPDFDTIILKISLTSSDIVCIPNADISLHDRDWRVAELCSEVKESVETGIAKVLQDMHYQNAAEHSVSFYCQSCDHPHPAEMSWHRRKPSKLRCSHTNKCSVLHPGCMVWFGEPLPVRVPKRTDLQPEPTQSTPSSSPSPQSPHLDPSQLREVFQLTLPLASSWHNIGLLLHVSGGELTSIEKECAECCDCLRKMLFTWLKQVTPRPTWKALAEAVEPFHPSLAQSITEGTHTKSVIAQSSIDS